ncbi:Oxo-4-hydroxy-4-carboxy-5-ureidoimidazoline decarboxylase [Astrocystis sublimbata]|nr:Oxo-4-hydroxy-4-carboxy-5-ureidoimidazoline decarboxylase [Astrocystis sublimbata]
MATPSLPPVSSLPTANADSIKSVLDTLFEPSPEIHALALPAIRETTTTPIPDDNNTHITFTSYAALIHHIGDLLHQLVTASSSLPPSSPSSSPTSPTPRDKLHSILGSHPRLGAKKVDSAQSRAEQAQLNTSAADEAERLAALNQEYEAAFPGLRYVVFVNGRGREVIMLDMRRRIDRGNIKAEEREGVQAMIDIALDRAAKLSTTG